MDGLRTGGAAIDAALEQQQSKGKGPFKPFLPNTYWDHDKQEKYLLILTPIEADEALDVMGSPQLDIVKIFEPKPNMVVAKTDPVIGERKDRFVDTWDASAKTTNLAIAVELEPIEEEVKGRLKPRGFKVATREYARKIYDEDGDPTDETEDVIVPEIGLIAQSQGNFFGLLKHANETEFPIHETAIKVTRHGEKTNTTYSFHGYEDIEVDLSNLIDYIGGLTYLGDSIEELNSRIEDLDPKQAALVIGDAVLVKRIEELIDPEIYDELFEGITKSMEYGGGTKKKGSPAKKAPVSRPSQRSAKTSSPDEASTESKLSKLREKAQAS